MTRLRSALLLTVAACHLGLVVAGGLDVRPWEWGPVGRALTYYSAIPGGGGGYSFYAPTVRSAPHAAFTIVDREGRRVVRPHAADRRHARGRPAHAGPD